MKKIQLMGIAVAVALGSWMYSCKKDNNSATTTDDGTTASTNAADQSRVDGESNQSLDDANTAIGSSHSMSGRVSGTTICNATVVTDSVNKKITITFHGNTCDGTRSRTGTITLQLTGSKLWKDVGAEVTATFTNYKVVRLSDNKSITFNGSHSLTNITGGLVYDVVCGTLQSIQHQVTGALTITFDNGANATWNASRIRTISKYDNLGNLQVSLMGNSTQNGISNVGLWGQTRDGKNFWVSSNSAVTANSYCQWHKPTSGSLTYTGILSVPVTVTFGTDASGNPVTTTGTCPAYYSITWTINGTAGSKVIAYL